MIVMGILNVTPDSFADGGRHNDFEAAVNRGHEMLAEGVDIIDVGGESTKPGVDRVSEEEELARVIPVIQELAKAGARISIDTMRASTARAAIEAGAQIINDVSGGLADHDMLPTAAQLGVPYIAMHWRGHSKDMNSRALYGDVVRDVISEMQERVSAALDAGITRASSSSSDTRSTPGLVDSPPISMMSTPSANISCPRFTAASKSLWRPPSAKESGVTFKIPMTIMVVTDL